MTAIGSAASVYDYYTQRAGRLDFMGQAETNGLRRDEARPAATGKTGGQNQDQALISDEARELASQKSDQSQQLDQTETLEVEDLKQRDREVRAHEQAHMAAAGNLARGGASFVYKTGPDGERYAVGGEVSIDTSPVDGDPKATLLKAQRIRQAALAPADPSGQDRLVAAEAAAMAVRAQRELAQQQAENY